MNLFFRVLSLIIKNIFLRHKVDFDHPSRLNFRVLPNDLDTNFHMNNGRFLTIMDLGRTDFLLRSGLLAPTLKNRWMPVLGSAHFRFSKSLELFEKYQLVTKTVYWDEKWFYMEQSFIRQKKSKTEVVGKGIVRALFKGRKGNVPPEEVMSYIKGHLNRSEHMAELIQKIKDVDRELI